MQKYGTKLGIYAAPAHKIAPEILDYATFIVLKSNDLSVIFDEDTKDEVLKNIPIKYS